MDPRVSTKICVDFFVPCARTLFKSIYGVSETENSMFTLVFLKPKGLPHEDFFVKLAIKKCSNDIKMENRPTKSSC